VVFVIMPDSTAIYVLGKEGVQYAGHVPHGLSALVQAVAEGICVESDAEALPPVDGSRRGVCANARANCCSSGAELRPVINSYEMTTGQPAGEVYWPTAPTLAWIAEHLVKAIEHEPMVINCQEWMPSVGLQAAEGLPAHRAPLAGRVEPGRRPAGAVGSRTEITQAEARNSAPLASRLRLSIESAGPRLVGRRFPGPGRRGGAHAPHPHLAGWQSMKRVHGGWIGRLAGTDGVEPETHGRTDRELRELRVRTSGWTTPSVDAGSRTATDFLMNLGRTCRAHADRPHRIERSPRRAGRQPVGTGGGGEPEPRPLPGLPATHRGDRACSPPSAPLAATRRGLDVLTFELTLRYKGSSP